MKINMPITNKEVMFDESEYMMTKTDLKGVITFANQSFIKISGFTEAELVGQSHNVVRHPDMPVEAFEDLWRNLKAGKPWTGLVKNRTKDGDYYWVSASVTPFIVNGQVAGYTSVRGKPSREQVSATESAYRLFKENKAQGLLIRNGKVVKNSIAYRLKDKLLKFNISSRILGLAGFSIIASVFLAGMGLYGMYQINVESRANYDEHVQSPNKLTLINKDLLEIRSHIYATLATAGPSTDKSKSRILDKTTDTKEVEYIDERVANIDKLWGEYKAGNKMPEDVALLGKFDSSYNKYHTEVLKPVIAALSALDYDVAVKASLNGRELFKVIEADMGAITDMEVDDAKESLNANESHYKRLLLVSAVTLGVSTLLLIWLGVAITRSVTNPLKKIIEVFEAISYGKLNTAIDSEGNNELSHVLDQLKSTQTMIGADLNVQSELAHIVAEKSAQYENQLAAISNSTGVIEFSMDGKVIAANDIILKVLGYNADEAIGQQHSAFVDDKYRSSPEYKAFWEKLNRGEAITGEFQHVGKNGKDIWVQASYNPILCAAGKPYKVVKYATDITEQKFTNADFEGQITAIGKSQGVIEIALDGTVLKANKTYLDMLGYTESELVGKHVSLVLDPTFAKSEAYRTLWDKLVNGGTDSGQYKRIAKGGREVWIQASYNPIYDLKGKPFKIVNYTMDITEAKLQAADNAGQISGIQKTQGVIEFDLTGKVLSVNDIFANIAGYSEKEIVGNHHSMFVEPAYRNSHEYKTFWDALGRGEAQVGQFKRIGKGGAEIWMQAIYNPIVDMNGKPFKVVKYATDITEQHNNAETLANAVEETQAIIEDAKTGDLSSRVPLEGKTGAIASLCDGVNALMDKMTEVIVQVREAGETINTAAGEISSGNNDLSQRTEQQASSLEETAASMEELASAVKNNAENAKQANQLAVAASGVAIKGGEVVGQVVSTMSAINSSAKKIEDIISVIDGIAFQTNILALNAAVEAARAGEQGRGFAVVAGEVRNLAQRSASAAKEIKELITDSVGKTAEGTAQVEAAGKTMAEIVSSVQRVTDIMGEITAASIEQSAGIDQVNAAVTSMDEVTQQNAALVEEAAAAAESLVDQAASLTEVVSVFKLSGGNTLYASRRAESSPMRVVNKPNVRQASKAITKFSSLKTPIKTGTDDGNWEEL